MVWKPAVYIHSKICWTQLTEVFNPSNRPWVNMAGADTNRIVEQVDRCPSGALSYYRNAEQPQPEEMNAETIVEVMPNGPLMVYGNLRVKYPGLKARGLSLKQKFRDHRPIDVDPDAGPPIT